MTGPQTYGQLLRLRGAGSLLLWASLGRIVFGGLPLAVLVLVATERDSYAEAGAALALYGLTAGLLGPWRTRVAARGRTRAAVVVMSVCYLLAVLLFLAVTDAPLLAVLATAALAGALPPPIGPLTRAEWKHKVGTDEGAARLAYSLDAASEEVIYVVAPVLASVSIGLVDPSLVVLAGGVIMLLAGLGLAMNLSAPHVRPVPSRDGEPVVTGSNAAERRPPSLLRNRGFLMGLTPITGLSMMLGGLDVTAIAAAIHAAGPSFAAVPAGVLAIGSFLGGLVYGRRTFRGSTRSHLLTLVSAATAALVVAAFVLPWPPIVLPVLGVAGVCISPAIVCSYLLAEDAVPEAGAEASAWVNSAFNLSLAAGSAMGGVLVGALDFREALLVLILGGSAVALLPELVSGRRTILGGRLPPAPPSG